MAKTTAINVMLILMILVMEISSSKNNNENNIGIIIDILVAIDVTAIPAFWDDNPIR